MNKKFRVWDTLAKRFILPNKGYQGHYILDLNGRFHDLGNGSGGDEYVVQQYIGVDDKNKNPIYEGDIITFKPKSNKPPFYIVKYDPERACFLPYSHKQKCFLEDDEDFPVFLYSGEIRILGNIFENPELLK